MRQVAHHIRFTAGGRPFSIPDALYFADSQGLLEPIRGEIGEGLACRQYALELGFELDGGQLQGAVETWRYGRELTSAQGTLAWLNKFELSVEDLSDQLISNCFGRNADSAFAISMTETVSLPSSFAAL